ncbi:MAG: HAD family hydrolase [Micromonosporaceae bacterium]
MRAVIFDFFGTLTDPAAEAVRESVYRSTGEALGVDGAVFHAAMADSFTERASGVHGDTRATLDAIARRCGARPSGYQLDEAVRRHLAGSARLRTPRKGTVETLTALRSRGLARGLISDCSSELCEAWDQTPYAGLIDAPVFSWAEGYRKPDQRLYATAAARLAVSPRDCWYVGDGASREHWGAEQAGMRPVLITNAGYPGAAGHRYQPDELRPDDAVDELVDLLALVDAC